MEEFSDSGLLFDRHRYDFWRIRVTLNDQDRELYEMTLKLIKPYTNKGISVSQLLEMKALNSEVYDCVTRGYRQLCPLAGEHISEQQLVTKTYCPPPNLLERFITSVAFEQLVQAYEAALWCTKKQEQINQAIVQIKQERLLVMLQSDGVQRANDDLSRNFMRTLEQFRKHHQWRMQHRVIDASGD